MASTSNTPSAPSTSAPSTSAPPPAVGPPTAGRPKTRSAVRAGRERAVADLITRFSGSMTFIGLHVLWFGAWVAFNVLSPHPFDAYPFGLLTLMVSLEAIFLSTFVLMSQNESATRDTERAATDHVTDLWSEAWSEMIGERLGISTAEVRKRYDTRVAQEDAARTDS